jgi:RNA polymerase sigma-B factor
MTALIARPVPATPTVSDHRDTDRVDRVGKMLLTRLTDLPEGSPDRPRLRDRVIEWYLPLAEHLARRFTGRGESAEDLKQVATIGLIKAVDGFDPDRGVEFTGYAVPTIVGELKRHFRDKGWSMRVPRRLQELKLAIGNATTALTQELGRSPTVADLATRLEISEDEVLEGLESANAYTAISLSTPVGSAGAGEDAGTEIGDLLGDLDPAMARVEDRAALRPLIARLSERDRAILSMRFFQNMTQSQIAERIGVSQMHVSRLLSRTLATLREELTAASAA